MIILIVISGKLKGTLLGAGQHPFLDGHLPPKNAFLLMNIQPAHIFQAIATHYIRFAVLEGEYELAEGVGQVEPGLCHPCCQALERGQHEPQDARLLGRHLERGEGLRLSGVLGEDDQFEGRVFELVLEGQPGQLVLEVRGGQLQGPCLEPIVQPVPEHGADLIEPPDSLAADRLQVRHQALGDDQP
jgi:hypothetical protein